jgi:hypothetical protein
MRGNNCRICLNPISRQDCTLWWENEDEGRSGDAHMECVLKKVTHICKQADCNSMYENDGECSECGSLTRRITEKDKNRVRNEVKKSKELIDK